MAIAPTESECGRLAVLVNRRAGPDHVFRGGSAREVMLRSAYGLSKGVFYPASGASRRQAVPAPRDLAWLVKIREG